MRTRRKFWIRCLNCSVSLNATDEQCSTFPSSSIALLKKGYAPRFLELEHVSGTMELLFDAIVKHIPFPRAKAGDGFQAVLVANLDYNGLRVGRIASGKIEIVEGQR